MPNIIQYFLFLSQLVLGINAPSKNNVERTGLVRSKETNKVLYQSVTVFNATEITTSYKKEDVEFASKIMRWETGKKHPYYAMNNLSTGHSESIEQVNGGIKISYKKNEKSKLSYKILPLRDDYAYNEGLIEYIKANWTALSSGENVSAAIVVPERLDYYHFNISYELLDDNALVTIKPDNFILRQFVSPIYLTFDKKGETLLFLEGLTNVMWNQSANHIVKITYTEKEI